MRRACTAVHTTPISNHALNDPGFRPRPKNCNEEAVAPRTRQGAPSISMVVPFLISLDVKLARTQRRRAFWQPCTGIEDCSCGNARDGSADAANHQTQTTLKLGAIDDSHSHPSSLPGVQADVQGPPTRPAAPPLLQLQVLTSGDHCHAMALHAMAPWRCMPRCVPTRALRSRPGTYLPDEGCVDVPTSAYGNTDAEAHAARTAEVVKEEGQARRKGGAKKKGGARSGGSGSNVTC